MLTQSILALLKSGKYIFCDDTFVRKNEDKIKLILVPTNISGTVAYIPVALSKYIHFTNGYISYKLQEIVTDREFNYQSNIVHRKKTVQINTLTDLFTTLNSLDNICYLHSIMDTQETHYGISIDLFYIEICLFNNDEAIYYYKKKFKSKGSINDEHFTLEILSEIEDLYDNKPKNFGLPFKDVTSHIVILDLEKKKYTIQISRGISDYPNNASAHELYGIFNVDTRTYIFLDAKAYLTHMMVDCMDVLISVNYPSGCDEMIYPGFSMYYADTIHAIAYIKFIVEAVVFLSTSDLLTMNMNRWYGEDEEDEESDVGFDEVTIHIYTNNQEYETMYQKIPTYTELFCEMYTNIEELPWNR